MELVRRRRPPIDYIWLYETTDALIGGFIKRIPYEAEVHVSEEMIHLAPRHTALKLETYLRKFLLLSQSCIDVRVSVTRCLECSPRAQMGVDHGVCVRVQLSAALDRKKCDEKKKLIVGARLTSTSSG